MRRAEARGPMRGLSSWGGDSEPPPHQLGGSGERCKLPQRVRGNLRPQSQKLALEIRNALNKRFVMYRLYQRVHGDPARGVLAVYSQGVSSNVMG